MLILMFLAGNDSLQRLCLADNVDQGKHSSLQHDIIGQGCPEILKQELNMSESSPKVYVTKEVDNAEPLLCAMNNECNQLEVADSEDASIRVEAAASAGIDDSCASSCQRNILSPYCQFMQELSTAIHMSKNLCLLDLSNNGLSTKAAKTLYTAWSSLRPSSVERHIEDQTIHLFVKGNKCCNVKPCCKKN